jgi:hypothetical protein
MDSLRKSGIVLSEEAFLELRTQVEGMDEVSEDQVVKKAMIHWIAVNPITYLKLLPENFIHFWWETGNYKENRSIMYILGRKLPYILLLICSMPSILWRLIQLCTDIKLSINMNVYHNIALILIFTYTAIYTILGAFLLRYHFPVELAMFIFLAETVLYLFKNLALFLNNFRVSMKAAL